MELVLERFLIILLEELQVWVWQRTPESGEGVVTVLEGLERELDEPTQRASEKLEVPWVLGGAGAINSTLVAAYSVWGIII